MRDLASALGGYNTDELEAQLRSGVAASSVRYEVLDHSLTRVGDVTTIAPGGVVTMNVDRAVKGSLSFAIEDGDPVLPLDTPPFSCYLKAYYRLLMPDGGYAEWPQGVYLWNKPKHQKDASGADQWTMDLGDRGSVLLFDGPDGFTIPAGARQTDAMVEVLQAVFGPDVDTSRIQPSDSTVVGNIVYDLTQNDPARGEAGTVAGTNGTTWADIFQVLTDSMGRYSLWFDADGAPVSMPTPDLASAPADVSYSPGPTSLLQPPLAVDAPLDTLANRVRVRCHSAAPDAPLLMATADLNDLIPGHPYSQAVISFYITAIVDDSTASTMEDLQKRANAELYSRAGVYQKVNISTFAWPVHEAFDIVGVQWDGDPDFDTEKTLHERTWTMDLTTGSTARELRRIAP